MTPPRSQFSIRPHDALGTWESNHGRYRTYAREMLAELEGHCKAILDAWPSGASAVITDPAQYPQIAILARRRNITSDSVRIYAAMAVEGFLNFYGVLRLGQQAYDEHFERLGIVPKLRALLLVCDQLQIPKNDPLVLCLDKVAGSRNALVHPKTKEVTGATEHKSTSIKVPDAAQESVTNMELFFTQFAQAVPDAAPLVNPKAAA